MARAGSQILSGVDLNGGHLCRRVRVCGLLVRTRHVQDTLNADMSTEAEGLGGLACLDDVQQTRSEWLCLAEAQKPEP